MNTSRYRHGILLCLTAAMLLALGSLPAAAQDKEPKKIEKDIKVMVDEDGNVTVNGKPVEGDRVELEDGTVVMRNENGKVVVIEKDDDSDGERVVRRHKMMHPGDEKHINVFRMKDGDDEFEWRSDAGDREHAAMARMHRMGGMLGEDFDFQFDFDFADPETMEMEAASRKLAQEARMAKGAEKAQKEKELSEKLSKIFDRKLENRRERIAKLRERLEKQQAELDERVAARAKIIERRKSELLGDDTLKW